MHALDRRQGGRRVRHLQAGLPAGFEREHLPARDGEVVAPRRPARIVPAAAGLARLRGENKRARQRGAQLRSRVGGMGLRQAVHGDGLVVHEIRVLRTEVAPSLLASQKEIARLAGGGFPTGRRRLALRQEGGKRERRDAGVILGVAAAGATIIRRAAGIEAVAVPAPIAALVGRQPDKAAPDRFFGLARSAELLQQNAAARGPRAAAAAAALRMPRGARTDPDHPRGRGRRRVDIRRTRSGSRLLFLVFDLRQRLHRRKRLRRIRRGRRRREAHRQGQLGRRRRGLAGRHLKNAPPGEVDADPVGAQR